MGSSVVCRCIQQPRLPLDRVVDSEEPLPSAGLSGSLMLVIAPQPPQCAGPVGAPRVVLLLI